MNEAAKVIKLIQSTPGSNDKLYLLKKNENVSGLKEILKFIYDPYLKTGISTRKLSNALSLEAIQPAYTVGVDHFVSYTDAIKFLTKNNTGSDTAVYFAAKFIRCTRACLSEDAAEIATAMVTQELTIGITATSLNKVYGASFIPKIGCMLGTKIQDVPGAKIKWPSIVTEKLDGVRRILVKRKGICRFYSRSGHEDLGLVEILQDAQHLPDNYVYDGELLAAGIFSDCIAQRQATNSIAASKGEKVGLIYNVFDMVPIDEFFSGTSSDRARERKIMLGATLMDTSISILDPRWPSLIQAFGIHIDLNFIKPVPILGLVNNMDEVTPIVEEIWARGYEGVMLNTVDGYYEIKRSKSLLKVKHTEEAILVVTGVLEGTGKFEDMLGALVVDYKGTKVGVGSGLSVAQRQDIWRNPVKYVGQRVEIDTFGESTNAAGGISLNCPIFKRFVGGEE